ncbi:MAG: sugar ABC transporter ATP-binding protein [Planctomycetia bacterium]|nr:sugar ABC transporter ATP-binding protein [Planctomycetia bacterium]
MQPILKLAGIHKSFGGVQALCDVSFDLLPGEVHALIGENGAGKSTLVKIITGAHQPDAGTIELAGQQVEDLDPQRARGLGIAAIYQQPALFPDLSVAENIAFGLEPPGFWRRVRWPARRARAEKVLEEVGAQLDPDAAAGTLTMPQQQLVEIAKAVSFDARVLILDEPTASLSDGETEHLFSVIRRLKAQGVGMIYISHRLDELPQIADRVTAFRDGRYVGTAQVAGTSRGELIRMMVGRELSAVFPKTSVPAGAPLLEARGLSSRAEGVLGIDLTVRAGEIVGLAGLVGAGRTELARVLFGLSPADAGSILFRGKPITIDSPGAASALGIAYVPEDRRRHGVILDLPVSANATLAHLPALSRWGLLDFAAERRLADDFVSRLAVKTPSIDVPVGQLSGGNQQKVALVRWLATEPSLLILDEPTQGIDVGSKAEIHRLMCELAARGLGILMISSELPEILGMSDRIVVMHAGTIVGELNRAEATQERVLELALGHGGGGPARNPVVAATEAPQRGGRA